MHSNVTIRFYKRHLRILTIKIYYYDNFKQIRIYHNKLFKHEKNTMGKLQKI